MDNFPAADTTADTGCDLPTTRRVRWVTSVTGEKNFKPEPASRTGAPRRAPGKDGRSDRAYRADQRVVRLAKDLRSRVPWLRHVPHQRIMPPLHRFALAGWTARDLQAHLDRLLELRGWTVPGGPAETVRDRFGSVHHRPGTTMRSPWGYLAFLLRHLDPTDLAAEQEHAAHLAAAEQYQRQLIYGVPCPHGQPAGDVPLPHSRGAGLPDVPARQAMTTTRRGSVSLNWGLVRGRRLSAWWCRTRWGRWWPAVLVPYLAHRAWAGPACAPGRCASLVTGLRPALALRPHDPTRRSARQTGTD